MPEMHKLRLFVDENEELRNFYEANWNEKYA